jgi:drug/metabolite transporter (DMT)-like permease
LGRTGPLLALVVVQFSFATLAVVGKDALLQGLPPVALAGLRVFFASLLLGAIALARGRVHVAWPDLGRLAGLSFLGVTANILLFIEGLKRTTAVNAIILIVMIPVFTLLVAVLLRRERFDAKRAAGVLIALAGASILLRIEDFDAGNDVLVGNVLIVLNCLSYSFYLVLSRPLLQRYPSILVVALTFLLGALVLFPLGLPRTFDAADAGVFTQRVVLDLVWIVLVPSVLAYALNNYALKRLRASTVASFVFLQPVFGVALALALLPGEALDPRTALAGAIVFAGVALVVRTEATPAPVVPPPTTP